MITLIKRYKASITTEDGAKIFRYFDYHISNALIYFKSDAFESEQEFRLYKGFFREDKEEYKDLKFRITSGLILPYLRVSLDDTSNKNNKMPIHSITYALSKDSALTKKSIELLLLKHGYDLKDIEIKESKVPLRFK